MSFWKSLKTVGKAFGAAPAIDLVKDSVQAHQEAKQNKRERRVAALTALASIFKDTIVLAFLVLGVLAFLFFASAEARESLLDFIKFFTG